VDIGEAQDSQILEESVVKANKINPSIINNKQEDLSSSREESPENIALAKLVSRDSNLMKMRSRLAMSPGSSAHQDERLQVCGESTVGFESQLQDMMKKIDMYLKI
jgi:hypothetical protein